MIFLFRWNWFLSTVKKTASSSWALSSSYSTSFHCYNLEHVLNFIPASHDFCHLLSHLLMFWCSLYGEQYEPRSDSSLWGSWCLLPWYDSVWSAIEYMQQINEKTSFQGQTIDILGLQCIYLSCSCFGCQWKAINPSNLKADWLIRHDFVITNRASPIPHDLASWLLESCIWRCNKEKYSTVHTSLYVMHDIVPFTLGTENWFYNVPTIKCHTTMIPRWNIIAGLNRLSVSYIFHY